MTAPVVLITGALTGIGRAAAIAFAGTGNRVVVSGRNEDAGEALVAELRALGAEAEFVRADVRNEDDVRNLIDRTVERFGRSTPLSTTPERKASPDQWSTRRPRAMPPRSTPMSWARF